MSEVLPERPRKPDFLFIIAVASSGVRFSFFIRYGTRLASMLPQRVPMIMPSRGVKPIEVSKHLPLRTAVTELPLPMWQVMILLFSGSRPANRIALWLTYLWEVP